MHSTVLDSIGVEIMSIVSPVSICMLSVVLIVCTLSSSNPFSDNDPVPQIRTAANLVYVETSSDSAANKLEGALLNALVFIVLVALVTFLLVLLYYYNYTNFLKNYMRFSAFFVLGMLGGSIFLSIIKHFSIPIDFITCAILLFNFSVVGVLSVFSAAIPILLRQGYMVAMGVFVAVWFTMLPEWTTWVSLIALAIYDLIAVLAPGGPLKMLVELAQSRDEELPAFIYEARPAISSRACNSNQFVTGDVESGAGDAANSTINAATAVGNSGDRNGEDLPLAGFSQETIPPICEAHDEMSHLVDTHEWSHSAVAARGVKLGLGDFIFYSVLLGRAAMYDLMTVCACYLAIISGLGCTLLLLFVWRQALPALPISITLGVIFYFFTRLLLEPFLLPMATNLLMF